jgi:ferredoxin
MKGRYENLKKKLIENKCFKVICGAGNEDKDEVKKISFIYSLAGATLLDVSANPEVVRASLEGINLANEFNSKYNIGVQNKPYIVVSVGMPGDHHVRKSYIDPQTCIGCKVCIPVCPTKAIPENFVENLDYFKQLGGNFNEQNQDKEIVVKDLCIGCGKCSAICPKDNIISYRHPKNELEKLLPECIDAGAESIELHAGVSEDNLTLDEWEIIQQSNPNQFNSVCLDRLNLSNFLLENRIEKIKNISKDKLIIQADGIPMSGGENDYNTTLQAIACADIINKKFNMRKNIKEKSISGGKASISSKKIYRTSGHKLGIFILVSGGTNQKTKKLAELTNVRVNGVSIGTYARDIIHQDIKQDNFLKDKDLIISSYKKAKKLVDANL